MKHTINPAFISPDATEYFRKDGRVVGITDGVTHAFAVGPKRNLRAIRNQMAKMPKVSKAINKLAGLNEISPEEQFAFCLLGTTDNIADIDSLGRVQMDEPIGCPKLHNCEFASEICLAVKAMMHPYSKAQVRIASHFPASPDEIASKLSISIQTVYSHEQNMRAAIGVNSREGLIYHAAKSNLV